MKQIIQLPYQSDNQSETDTVEFIDFVLQTINLFQEAKADGGGINWKDTPKLLSLIGPADAAFEGDENIVPFLKTATELELESVLAHINQGLPFNVDRETLELSEKAAVAVYILIRHIATKKAAEVATDSTL